MHPDGYDGAGFFQKLANLYNLQKFIDELVINTTGSGRNFALSEELVRTLHRVTMVGLLDNAGHYRVNEVEIKNSPHVPPSSIDVPAHMGALCRHINEYWYDRDLVFLSAFAMWRMNWIHPFSNGNGRVSRGLSYLILCMKHGELLPAKSTVTQQIAENKKPYYAALRQADKVFAATNDIDASLEDMCQLISHLLKEQLTANL